MIICVYCGPFVEISVFETNVKTTFKSLFRSCPFSVTKCEVIVNSTVKIFDKFRNCSSLIGYQRTNTLNFTEKKLIIILNPPVPISREAV